MVVGTIAGLWRYPVKSMPGERIEAARIGERGLEGDRAHALIDRTTGKVASVKHPRLWERLLACRAVTRADAGDVIVILPDGRAMATDDAGIEAALSEALGRAVALSSAVPAVAELEKYWPDIEGLPLRDALTTGTLGGAAPPGTFFDYAPIHLLTTASLERLRALYPAGSFEAPRFRPNLLIAPADGTSGFVENAWVSRTLRIGERVRLRVIDPTPRCVATTLPQGDLPRDPGILRAIAAHNRPPIPALAGEAMPSIGAYAVVEAGGMVRQGDAVRLVYAEE